MSTNTTRLTTIKLLLNSVISSAGARLITADVKIFYINKPMKDTEYMHIPIKLIPNEIQEEYKTSEFEHNGYVYVQISKWMYGLAQAGLLANDIWSKRLVKHGFAQTQHTTGMWKHHSNSIQFTWVVNDFGVKYNEKKDTQDLIKVLREHYKAVSLDWTVKLLCDIKIDWDDENRAVNLSMPGYIAKLLKQFFHPTAKILEHQTHQHVQPQYGTKVQFTEPEDKYPCYNPMTSPNSKES